MRRSPSIDMSLVAGWAATVVSLIAGWAATVLATDAQAQQPKRPVTLVVPFSPVGSNDIVAVQPGFQLADVLECPMVIETGPAAGQPSARPMARASRWMDT